MAAALLDRHARGRVVVRSAGTEPSDAIDPTVVEVLGEVGVDVGGLVPKSLTDDAVRAADVVVTMGCDDTCSVYPGKQYEDWDVEDPASKDLVTVRRIRDEIDRRVRDLIDRIV